MLSVALRTRNYENVAADRVAKQTQQASYYTLADLSEHRHHYDCWVAINGNVLDLTPLVVNDTSELALPIVEAAGRDISHWFDAATGNPALAVQPSSSPTRTRVPATRFTHVPPAYPCGEWSTKIGSPWWRNDRFIVGKLTRQSRKVRIVNVLTQHSVILEIPCEDTVDNIKERYSKENHHGGSYEWTYMAKPLNMEKTLEENGVPDKRQQLERLGLPAEDCIPTLHLQFRDDLTVA